jgi:hypothetical protein
MSALLLSPVSAGLYTALNVVGVTSLASGPFDTDVPQATGFPCVWFVVQEENARGFGRGGLRKISARVHAAATGSAAQGAAKQLQGILGAVVATLEDATLTISGYTQGGEVVYSDTTDPFPSEIGGQVCWESIANFYFWVQ